MMRKTMAAVAAAGSLLLGAGVAAASPAQAATQWTLVCNPQLGETLVNGTCVLPAGNLGQGYRGIIEAGNGTVDNFTITSGSLPPPTQMTPPTAFGTQVATNPYQWLTQQGTFTFTVNAVAPDGSSAQQAYSVTVGPPLPLTISASSLPSGTVGQQYYATLAAGGGVPPFTWSLASGQLPPGIVLGYPPYYPSELNGIPTVAGKYTFTIRVTDSLGNQATQQFRLTINK